MCFNPQLFIEQRRIRKQAIEDYQDFVQKLNQELSDVKRARNYRATMKKFTQYLTKKKLANFITVKLGSLIIHGFSF